MHITSCYYISVAVTATFSDARVICQNFGADLTIIKSPDENDFLYDLVKNYSAPLNAWIGLRRRSDKKFYWLNDTSLLGNYQRWNAGEPNNLGGGEDCAEMLSYNNGTWNDLPCSNSGRVALCQKPF